MSRSKENWYFVAPMLVVAGLFGRPSPIVSSQPVDALVDGLGFVLVLIGVLIRAVSRDWKISQSGGRLVTSGPYTVVRNPMYLGSLLAGFGLCIVFGSVPLTLAFVLAFLVVHELIVRREERCLRSEHGDEYDTYLAEVPAWFPSISGMWLLLSNSFSWMRSVPAALLRERHAIFGNLAGACLLEALADTMVMGWRVSHHEVVFWIVVASILVVSWNVLGLMSRRSIDGAA